MFRANYVLRFNPCCNQIGLLAHSQVLEDFSRWKGNREETNRMAPFLNSVFSDFSRPTRGDSYWGFNDILEETTSEFPGYRAFYAELPWVEEDEEEEDDMKIPDYPRLEDIAGTLSLFFEYCNGIQVHDFGKDDIPRFVEIHSLYDTPSASIYDTMYPWLDSKKDTTLQSVSHAMASAYERMTGIETSSFVADVSKKGGIRLGLREVFRLGVNRISFEGLESYKKHNMESSGLNQCFMQLTALAGLATITELAGQCKKVAK